MNGREIDADEAEIARILSSLPEFSWMQDAEIAKIRHAIKHEIVKILREYYRENTQGPKKIWSERFRQAGITDDDGKTAISCARRLGFEIS